MIQIQAISRFDKVPERDGRTDKSVSLSDGSVRSGSACSCTAVLC